MYLSHVVRYRHVSTIVAVIIRLGYKIKRSSNKLSVISAMSVMN